eukprot:TRINITY_DN9616_c0_g1_i5.p1 TRINITY_DN9616_c0_g1~~TRINITY_DN9616_c0_g1_i5.p1  ORF type:complete len:192 (-),score=48.75 TRINITY_DN9616_c0_g1_i5:551-1126(-)
MDLLLDSSAESLVSEVLANYLQLVRTKRVRVLRLGTAAAKQVTGDKLPLLVSEGETKVSGSAIFEVLVHTAFAERILIPTKDVLRYNEYVSRKVDEALLNELNTTLVSTTFIAGHHITLADLVLFGLLVDEIALWDTAQKVKFVSLTRWFVHLQNLPGLREFLERSDRNLIVPLTLADVQAHEVKGKKKGK